MSYPTLTVAAIPMATVPVQPVAAAAPISAEEAAALASRMRVEARLPRVTAIGATLGLVCGVASMWPFLSASDYVVKAMVSDSALRWAVTLIPLALAGLLPLLAFYALRLQFQAGRSTPGAIEDNLRKIRRILAACMFLALGAIVAVLSEPGDNNQFGVAGLYAMSFAACGIIVDDVRRGLGEFDTADQRRRRKLARGFEVELKSGGGAVAAIPVAAVAPIAALPVDAASADAAPARPPGTPPPLPIPAAPRAAAPQPTPALPLAASVANSLQAERDLRTMLHLLAVVGIGLYVLRTPSLLLHLENFLEVFGVSKAGRARGRSGPAQLSFYATVFRLFLEALITVAGIAWMVWGVIVLNYGARLRAAALLLAWSTLGCALLSLALYVTFVYESQNYVTRAGRTGVLQLSVLPYLAESVHAVMMCALLTRPRVRDLFAVGSEMGEIGA
jgi:hypothetical protein